MKLSFYQNFQVINEGMKKMEVNEVNYKTTFLSDVTRYPKRSSNFFWDLITLIKIGLSTGEGECHYGERKICTRMSSLYIGRVSRGWRESTFREGLVGKKLFRNLSKLKQETQNPKPRIKPIVRFVSSFDDHSINSRLYQSRGRRTI